MVVSLEQVSEEKIMMLNDIIYMVLKVVIIVVITLITRYLIPWIREKIGNEQYDRIEKEINKLVLSCQQMHPGLLGSEKRDIVTKKIIDFLASKDIQLSEEQIRDLLESAVKSMKLQENNNNG